MEESSMKKWEIFPEEQRIRREISCQLVKLGFMPMYKGYKPFVEIIALFLNGAEESELCALYRRVADICKMTATAVERDLRGILAVVHKATKFKEVYKYFNYYDDICPTIGQALSLIGHYIQCVLFEVKFGNLNEGIFAELEK